MSNGIPDPFHERGDDFWDFDNMVTEYEYEQQRRKPKQKIQSEIPNGNLPTGKRKYFIVEHTAIAVVILIGLAVSAFFVPLLWIAFIVYVLCM